MQPALSVARADELAQWQEERDTKFAAFKAAHNQNAEIADIKAKTAAMIAAYVPPPNPPRQSTSDLADFKRYGHSLRRPDRAADDRDTGRRVHHGLINDRTWKLRR